MVLYAIGAPRWRWAPTPSRSSEGWVVANSRAIRSIVSAVDPADLGPVRDRSLGQALEQLVVALGMGTTPVLVRQAGVHDRAHHPQGQGRVGPRKRPQVLVGDPRRAAAEGVDDDQPGAGPPRLEQLLPEMRGGRHRVPAPDQEVAGVRPLLGIHLGREPMGCDDAGDAGAGADRPHQPAGADRVHEPVGDRAALERALRAHVAVGEHRFAAVLLDRGADPLRADVDRLLPARGTELARALRAGANQRLEDPVLRVDAIEVVGDLAAEEARGDRMVGVSADRHRAPRLVHRRQHRAGVGAIVWAGSANDPLGHRAQSGTTS